MRKSSFLLASVLLALATTTAFAANRTFDVTFQAQGFEAGAGSPGTPVPTVSGSFQIVINQTATYQNVATGLSNFVLNGINLGSALSFTYSPTGVPLDSDPGELVVGGAFDGAAHVQFNPPTNDFLLQIPDFFGTHTFQQLLYSQTGIGAPALFFTDIANEVGSGSVGVTEVFPNGVPEPRRGRWG